MTHPRRRSDEPPPEPDLAAEIAAAADLRARAEERLAQVGQLIEAARAGLPLPEGLTDGRLNLIGTGLRHLGSETDRYVRELERIRLGQVFGQAAESWIRQDERQQAAASHGRHRASRSRKPGRGQLELIPGGKTTAAAVGLAASLAAGMTVGPGAWSDLAHFSPAPAAAHAAPSLPVLSPADAIPVSSPLQRRPYEPRHAKKPNADAATATPAPPPPVVTAAPAPQVSAPAPSAPAPGTLDVQTALCVAGVSGRCFITFMAAGGDVEWQASASDPALSLDQDGGTLAAGESVTVTVSVKAGSLAGAGWVTITDGNGNAAQVRAVWAALPLL